MPVYRIEARTAVYCYREHCAPSEKQAREWVRDELREGGDGLEVAVEEVTDATTVPLEWRVAYPWTDVNGCEKSIRALLEKPT